VHRAPRIPGKAGFGIPGRPRTVPAVADPVINVFRSPIQRRFQHILSREMGHDRYSPVIKAWITGRF
jgi:hypothetical protein